VSASDLIDFWPVAYATILQFWRLVNAPIEAAATQSDVPLELYSYVELGLEDMSIAYVQKRDPYSNPQIFLPVFTTLAAQGWIEPAGDQLYHVTKQARSAVRQLVRSGDEALGELGVFSTLEAKRLIALLQRIVTANAVASEPPEKWATTHRFRVADDTSPLLGQVREYLLDLFAYRDDAHLSAWRGYHVTGPAWNALTLLWRGEAVSPTQIAEQAAFRGYLASEYVTAIGKLVGRGWVETADTPGTYRVTEQGQALREGVELQTDAYFYAPWSCLNDRDITELRGLVIRLHGQLEALP
jgi:DNA-binding MarR family transcriptional regulator